MAWSIEITALRHTCRKIWAHTATRLGSLGADQQGISSVQYAMVLPAVLAAVMGTVDMGRMMFAQNTLVHAANEATRYAMVRSEASDHMATKEDVVALAKGKMTGLDATQAVVEVRWDPPENVPGARVTVDIDYPYTLSALGLGTVNLNGSSSTFVTH
ncbi:MAG: TadE/TadG family type IV pilus assembly protein [Alphaproteobacteria bacterium]